MIDGAAWLKQLQERPGEPVLLPHDEAVELARTLVGAQVLAADRRRMDAARADLALNRVSAGHRA